MFEKEEAKIILPIKKFIHEKILSSDFKSKKGRVIGEVLESAIFIEIDEDSSDIRNEIVIKTVDVRLRVLELWDEEGSSSTENLILGLNRPLIIKFNNDLEEYEIIKSEKVSILNHTQY